MFDLDSLNDEILKINAVQFVYVKSSYKSLTSKYKKSNRNINIYKIYDLPFDVMCVFTWKNDDDDTVTNEPKINKFLETTSK